MSARTWFIAGMVLLLAVAALLLVDVAALFKGYLFAWLLWIGPALGAAALMMMHQLTGGRWGDVLRLELRSAVLTLPIAALLFAPLLVGFWWVYPWVHEPVGAPSAILHFKPAYLQPWFFVTRSVVYLGLWAVGGWMLWSLTRREHGVTFAGGGLVLYFLTVTFAGYDWVATLEPEWYSSIYGLYTIIGQAVAAIAVMIALVARREGLDSSTLRDLGNLLLAMVVLWAYLAYSQFFIIWNADLPHQIKWYVHRTEHGWGIVAIVLIGLHFALPFAALLSRTVKQRGRALVIVASVVLVAHVIDMIWRVLPSYAEVDLATIASGVLASLGIGACMVGMFKFAIGRARQETVHA